VQNAQLHLFLFLGAVAAGTFIGGPVGDRIGRKKVIWVSILGVLPFTLLMPYASLRVTELLTVIIGLILASAFSAIVVFAQELVPAASERLGTLSSGLPSARRRGRGAPRRARRRHQHRRRLPDLCVPARLGLLTYFLPNVETGRRARPALNGVWAGFACRRALKAAHVRYQPGTFAPRAFTSLTSARRAVLRDHLRRHGAAEPPAGHQVEPLRVGVQEPAA
jgi:hypothetical protein